MNILQNRAGSSQVADKDSARGWSIVFAAFVGLLLSFGTLVIYSFGVIASAMQAEFGWGSFQRGTLFTAASLAATIGGPLWGVLADRYTGARVAVVASASLAIAFLGLAVVPGDLVAMHVAFALLGLVGGGTMPPIYAGVLVEWFDRRRGLALGLAMTSIGVGAAIMPLAAAALTTRLGWRMTFAAYGMTIVVVVLPVLLALLKQHPRSCRSAPARQPRAAVDLRPILGQRTIWTLALFAFLSGAVLVTSVSNFVPILQSRGVTLEDAARFQSVLGISLVVGRVALGGLLDRLFAPYVMAVVLVATGAGLIVLSSAQSTIAYLLAGAGIGLAIGAEVDFLGYVVSRYFPRAAFTTLFATLFSLYALGASVAPILFGWLAETANGYGTGLTIFAGMMLAVAVAMLTLPDYARDHGTAQPGSPQT